MCARIRQCVVLPTVEFPVVGERIAIVCLLEPWRKVKPFRDDIARQGITQEVTQQIPVNGRIACDLHRTQPREPGAEGFCRRLASHAWAGQQGKYMSLHPWRAVLCRPAIDLCIPFAQTLLAGHQSDRNQATWIAPVEPGEFGIQKDGGYQS